MTLPQPETQWPPKDYAQVFDDMEAWQAWWEGAPEALRTKAGKDVKQPGFWKRLFWGRNNNHPQDRPSRSDLHIPLAADLATTSANLLYAIPPTISTTTDAAGVRISEYINDGLFETLLTGAELSSVHGGRYHRVTIDPATHDKPFLTTIDATQVIPRFRWGKLIEATIWTIVHREDSGRILRHVEHHSLTPNGLGMIHHALYEGTKTSIGVKIPLNAHHSTEQLEAITNDYGEVKLPQTPGLYLTYYPNITPQRRWRDHIEAKNYGRSDFDGLTPIMDALDEVYSSWMRDIRLGKARVLIAKDLLEYDKNGTPLFDLDREVFTPLEGLIPDGADSLPMSPIQFNIRVEEHARTAQALTEQIINGAGYSLATFGEHDGDADITATEVRAREKRTLTTRERKIRLEKTALTESITKMLTCDQAIFNTSNLNAEALTIEFPSIVHESPGHLSQTVSMLKTTQLISTKTALEMLHPDWDKTKLDEEAEIIAQENAIITSPDEWKISHVNADTDV